MVLLFTLGKPTLLHRLHELTRTRLALLLTHVMLDRLDVLVTKPGRNIARILIRRLEIVVGIKVTKHVRRHALFGSRVDPELRHDVLGTAPRNRPLAFASGIEVGEDVTFVMATLVDPPRKRLHDLRSRWPPLVLLTIALPTHLETTFFEVDVLVLERQN